MHILLVNNSSDTWQELQAVTRAAGHDVTAVSYSNIGAYNPHDYEAAILSGGWWYDDEIELLQHYAEELHFIKTSPIPILGICIGMQLMHVSLDQAVPLLDVQQSGFKDIAVTTHGQALFSFPPKLHVFKNHTRGVIEADPNFEVLAISPGHVEIIRHRSRPLLGVQFHPEVGEIVASAQLLNTLLRPITNLKPRVMEGAI